MRDRPHSVDSDFVSSLKRPQLGGRNILVMRVRTLLQYALDINLRKENPMLMGRTSTFRLYLYNAISLDSAASFPRRSGKSPLPHRVARCAAAVAQVSLEDARNALFRCQGVICWSPPDVSLLASFAAFIISSSLTVREGKSRGTSDSSSSSPLVLFDVPRIVWSFSLGYFPRFVFCLDRCPG